MATTIVTTQWLASEACRALSSALGTCRLVPENIDGGFETYAIDFLEPPGLDFCDLRERFIDPALAALVGTAKDKRLSVFMLLNGPPTEGDVAQASSKELGVAALASKCWYPEDETKQLWRVEIHAKEANG